MANKHRWSASVKTDSTHPPAGLFNKDAATIARTLASKRVSPKGPGSGMRMLTFYINRAGHNLSAKRRAVLNRAKVAAFRARAPCRRSKKTKELILRGHPSALARIFPLPSLGTYRLRSHALKTSV